MKCETGLRTAVWSSRKKDGEEKVFSFTNPSTEMSTCTFDVRRAKRPSMNGVYTMTEHAMNRMCERGMHPNDIFYTLKYGEAVYDRGALVFRLGKKHVRWYSDRVDLESREGVHVVCTTSDHNVMTVYRNREFRAPKTTRR